MLTAIEAEDEALEERLQNWGRWMRETRTQGKSAICALLDLRPEEPGAPEEKAAPVDSRDAELVQEAWRMMPLYPERYRVAKILIGVVYAESHKPIPVICRTLRDLHGIRVRYGDLERLLIFGKMVLGGRIQKIQEKNS